MESNASGDRIAVKFDRKIDLPYEEGAERAFAGAERQGWDELVREVGAIRLEPLFDIGREALDALLELAHKNAPEGEPTHLRGWFTILHPDAPEKLAGRLLTWPAVEEAYVMPAAAPPLLTVGFQNDPAEPTQRFHLPAPEGIDARYAWGFIGGDGSPIGVADVENGWDLTPADFQGALGYPFGPGEMVLVSGYHSSLTKDTEHGAAVLGVLAARDNAIGGVGIAPRARVRLCSTLRAEPPTNYYSTAAAIAAAAAANIYSPTGPSPGDVVLIEVGLLGPLDSGDPVTRDIDVMLPVEAEPAAYDAIRAATDAGFIVVEPAGNSSVNLDQFRRHGDALLDRSSPDFRDSGAIMVSACFSGSATPRARMLLEATSEATGLPLGVAFGNRIDCFAWGDNVKTGLGGLDPAYPGSLGNTSAAAAIVAGGVLCVQGVASSQAGGRLTPSEIRDLFSNTSLNTPSADPAVDRIGVMPDLRRIIRLGLEVLPHTDMMLRDFPADEGWPSESVELGNSPDIYVLGSEADDPQSDLGNPGLRPSSLPLQTFHDPSYIYLRARNIGADQANNVTAVVYWSVLEDLLDPSRWNLIGNVGFPPVPADASAVTVSDPLVWSEMPEPSDTVMLIAFVRGDQVDPMPYWPWSAFASEDDLKKFVGATNNLATRQIGWLIWYWPPFRLLKTLLYRYTGYTIRKR